MLTIPVILTLPDDVEDGLLNFINTTGLDFDRCIEVYIKSLSLKSLDEYNLTERCRLALEIMVSQYYEQYDNPLLESML